MRTDPKKIPAFALNDGACLPAIGFGTYPLKGAFACQTVALSVSNGYRLIDSAYNYENEGAVGQAMELCAIPREELFLTSKLPGRYQKFEAALTCIEESLYRTRAGYFDLYLIHWPNPRAGLFVEAWRALIEARKRGWVRSIGVSNFLPEHIEVLKKETAVMPAVNQIEIHPYFPNAETVDYNRSQGIQTQSWSPFARGQKVFAEVAVQTAACALEKTPAQIVLRWHYQRRCLPIPKASTAARQLENIGIFDFELSAAQMALITALGRADGRSRGQDPAVYEEF